MEHQRFRKVLLAAEHLPTNPRVHEAIPVKHVQSWCADLQVSEDTGGGGRGGRGFPKRHFPVLVIMSSVKNNSAPRASGDYLRHKQEKPLQIRCEMNLHS